jgi:hypothetical protein
MFVAGAAAGAAVCLLLIRDGDGPPGLDGSRASAAPRDRASPAADTNRIATADGTFVASDAPARAPRAPEPQHKPRHATAPAAEDGEEQLAKEPPVASGTVLTADGSKLQIVDPGPIEGRTLELVLTDLHLPERPMPMSQGLTRARRLADQIAPDAAPDLDAMLRSSDDTEREAAIGLAARADPPEVARLLAVARDAGTPGSLRATALLAAANAAPDDARVAAAVIELTSDRNVDVRRAAIGLLPWTGASGADRAAALLRSGEYAADLLEPLARAVAASSRAAEFLAGRPAADAAFAVLHAIGETQPAEEASRNRLLARLPDVVRPLLDTPDMLAHGAEVFGVLASAGHVSFLREVATSPTLPTATRLAAVDAAVAAPACAAGLASLFTSVLADQRSPVELLRAALQRVPALLVADGGVKAVIVALAQDHPNAWLREDARAKLQASPPPAEAGGLTIVSGIYGMDGKTVDVTAALASMIVGGRLVVEAGNHLAGDPLVGIVKELTVTYVWKGERRTRTISEYETLTLP